MRVERVQKYYLRATKEESYLHVSMCAYVRTRKTPSIYLSISLSYFLHTDKNRKLVPLVNTIHQKINKHKFGTKYFTNEMAEHIGLLTSCVNLGLACASAREADLLETAETRVPEEGLVYEVYQGGVVGKTDLTGMNPKDGCENPDVGVVEDLPTLEGFDDEVRLVCPTAAT